MTDTPILESVLAATPLPVLRLLSSRGLPRQGVLSLRLEGRGMADALALAEPHLNDVEWRDANRCRIVWRTEGWMLSNESRTWVCALNGSRIQTGEQAILRIGDMLEVGLLRFLVDKEQSGARYTEQSAPVARSPWLDDASAGSDGTVGRIAGSHFVDRHAGSWHGVAAPSVKQAFFKPEPARTADHAQAGRHDVSPRIDGLVTAASSSDAATTLLVALHGEFLRAMRDSVRPGGPVERDGVSATGAENDLALDASNAKNRPSPVPRDILRQREGIDEVLDGFGPSGDDAAARLAAMFGTRDVLRLFAPDDLSAVASHLPSPTSRTHHALSSDSPMPSDTRRSDGDRRDMPGRAQ